MGKEPIAWGVASARCASRSAWRTAAVRQPVVQPEGESASGDDSVEKLESERPDASVSTNHSVTGLSTAEQRSVRLPSLRWRQNVTLRLLLR